MARTWLFGALKRWARLAWIAERQRRPTRECVEQVAATWCSTRRELLRTALGGTTLAALPFTSCTSFRGHHSGTERVAIVGAGDTAKLVIFIAILALLGNLARLGRLPRTRPIVPGEIAVSD